MVPDLYHEEKGDPDAPSLVFLHGLLGSSRNWRTVSKVLAGKYHTLCFDLPNHGKSYHRSELNVQDMAKVILDRVNEMGISNFSICGHSLGGKVAMRMACDRADLIERLVVVDIAPREYPPEHHLPTLNALIGLDLGTISSRKEADEALTDHIPNWAFRQFLLTNLEVKDGTLSWLPNLDGLKDSIADLSSNPLSNEQYNGETLFICGGRSGYVRSEHHDQINQFFPTAKIKTLANAGHDVHVEDREGFLTQLQSFLQD